MLELKILGDPPIVVRLEHSLRSLSKWEQKYKRPFTRMDQTPIEMIDYFSMMVVDPDIDPDIVVMFSPEQLVEIQNYIGDSRTASAPPETEGGRSSDTVTAELIYYWMTELQIDWEAQDWHLSTLMMLIRVMAFKRQPEKKVPHQEQVANYESINERNKRILGTRG